MRIVMEDINKLMRKFSIFENDIIESFISSGGPGGQHVNKTASCVYLKHIPTGIEVKCQSQRSQASNRITARKILVKRIEELYLNKNDISLLSDAIGNFQQLKTCEVAENDLQGLPSTMRSLSNLTKLDIRGMPRNSVSSAFLESLVSLKDVYASSELGGQLTSPYITTRFTVH